MLEYIFPIIIVWVFLGVPSLLLVLLYDDTWGDPKNPIHKNYTDTDLVVTYSLMGPVILFVVLLCFVARFVGWFSVFTYQLFGLLYTLVMKRQK